MQTRILVPLDGSALAERILTQVKRLLVRQDHEVILLTVVPADPDPVTLDRRLLDARERLTVLRDRLVDEGALVSVEARVGDPAEQIVACAARRQVELVVMATHGRTGLSRLVRGSVAEAVLRACPVPVLVANPEGVGATGPAGELRFGRLLVPLDGSDASAQVLPLAEEFATRFGSEVLLLHVAWTQATVDAPYPTAALRPAEELQAVLEPARQRLASRGLRARALAGYGAEAMAILDTAAREQVDLVVMATHGRHGAARALFGSITEQVLRHCGRPLLVQRVREPEAA